MAFADDHAIVVAHELLDAAGINKDGNLEGRLRLLIEERDQLRHVCSTGEWILMTAWCDRNDRGDVRPWYRERIINVHPELAQSVPEVEG